MEAVSWLCFINARKNAKYKNQQCCSYFSGEFNDLLQVKEFVEYQEEIFNKPIYLSGWGKLAKISFKY